MKAEPSIGAPPQSLQLQQATNDLRAARARYVDLTNGPSAATIARAYAELQRAQAELGKVGAPAGAADVAVAQAQASEAELWLRAPPAGVVASIIPAVGEYVSPGAVVAQLGDVSTWATETDNLTELGVVRVAVGDIARVSVDAVPDLVLRGTVTAICQVGESKQGDIVCAVTIAPETQDAHLRWNMTAAVPIGE